MNTPLGRCPICTEPLEQVGELLQCPAGDYRVNGKDFSDRWDRFDEDARRLPLGFSDPGINKLSKDILRDLQEMNIKEQK